MHSGENRPRASRRWRSKYCAASFVSASQNASSYCIRDIPLGPRRDRWEKLTGGASENALAPAAMDLPFTWNRRSEVDQTTVLEGHAYRYAGTRIVERALHAHRAVAGCELSMHVFEQRTRAVVAVTDSAGMVVRRFQRGRGCVGIGRTQFKY